MTSGVKDLNGALASASPRRFDAKRRWPSPKAQAAPLADMLDFYTNFDMKAFCPSQKNKRFVLQTKKKIKMLIKNPICLPGGQLGLRPRPPPLCMKSAGAVQACNTGGLKAKSVVNESSC